MRDLQCGKVMVRDVHVLQDTDSVAHAARAMRDLGVGFAPVLNAASQVVGVITDRDLATRVLAEEKPADTPLSQVMSRNPVFVRTQDSIRSVEDKMMMFRIQRVPVINDDRTLAGIISVADLARFGEDGETAVIVGTRSHSKASLRR